MHKVVLLLFLACNPSFEQPNEPNKGTDVIEKAQEGALNCICTMQYQPVCSENKKQYSNPCMAECEGVKNYTLGECE